MTPTCHGRVSDLLVLPPLLMKGLSVVPPVLGQIPLIQSIPAIKISLRISRVVTSSLYLLLVCGLHRQLGVVSHHGVGLVAGLVVLVDHPVLLGSRSSLVISLGKGTRLPEVIPRGGATSNIVVKGWTFCIFLVSNLPIPLLAMLVRLTCLARTLVDVTRVFMSPQVSANTTYIWSFISRSRDV